MILADIRDYLRDRGHASLADIVHHFDADPGAARHMLEVWIRKGRISRHHGAKACGGCAALCDPMTTEIYSWVSGTSDTRPPAGCRFD